MNKSRFFGNNSHAYLLLIFFFSGFTGLIYEIAWVRILSVVFGRTTLAVSVVVAVYMAGLGLGSIYWGKKIDAIQNRLRMFSLLQLGIALSSFIITLLFLKLDMFYKFLFQVFHVSGNTSIVLISILSFIILLVPTTLMGGTLPVITRHAVKNNRDIGSGIATVYAVNTIGGIIGAGLSGYYLIGRVGQIQTQLFAIFISLLLGYSTYSMRPEQQENTASAQNEADTVRASLFSRKIIVLIAGISGFCSLAYEILASRALGIFLVNSTYSFSSILVIYLTGIGVGSLLFAKYIKETRQLPVLLLLTMGISGVYIIVVTSFLNDLPLVLSLFERTLLRIPVFKVFLPGIMLSSVLLLIPALLMGISFPAMCRIYTQSVETIGAQVGKLYFVNTLGCVLGSLLAGIVMIPLLGVVRGCVLIAGVYLVTAVLLVSFEKTVLQKKTVLTVFVGLTVVSLIMGAQAIRNPVIHPPSLFRSKNRTDTILHYKETLSGTVLVREDTRTGIRVLYVNNNQVCGINYDALKLVKLLGHMPFFINPTAQDVLIIGFGIGVTTGEVAKHAVRSIDCVEICPGVRDAAGYFSKHNNNVVNNSKVHFIDGDGRNHLLLTDKKYDIISCDPTHPTLGCGNLYTQEYFQLCKDHITPKGVVCQYLPLHRVSPHDFIALIKTFHSVFTHATVWLGHSHGVLIGTKEPTVIDFQGLKQEIRKLQDNLVYDPYVVVLSMLLDAQGIKQLDSKTAIHKDNRPFLEFYRPESVRNDNWHINLATLLKQRVNPANIFVNIDDQQKMNRYIMGQTYFLNGLMYKSKGDLNKAAMFYQKALEINPENREWRDFLAYEKWRDQKANATGE